MDHLPLDSAVRRSVHGDDFVEWTKVVDMLSQIRYMLEGANWQRNEGKGPEPKPEIQPVPWDKDPWPDDGKE